MKKYILFLLFTTLCFSQGIRNTQGIGAGYSDQSMPNSAILEARSTTKGFLPPRMTATQASAISSPAQGLMIFVTSTNGTFTSTGFWGYNGTSWISLGGGSSSNDLNTTTLLGNFTEQDIEFQAGAG